MPFASAQLPSRRCWNVTCIPWWDIRYNRINTLIDLDVCSDSPITKLFRCFRNTFSWYLYRKSTGLGRIYIRQKTGTLPTRLMESLSLLIHTYSELHLWGWVVYVRSVRSSSSRPSLFEWPQSFSYKVRDIDSTLNAQDIHSISGSLFGRFTSLWAVILA